MIYNNSVNTETTAVVMGYGTFRYKNTSLGNQNRLHCSVKIQKAQAEQHTIYRVSVFQPFLALSSGSDESDAVTRRRERRGDRTCDVGTR